MRLSIFILILLTSSHAAGASFISNDIGYDGPILSLAPYGNEYVYGSGPTPLRGGVIFSSNRPESAIGNGLYGILENGIITIPIIALNSQFGEFNLQFTQPVKKFAARTNYFVAGGQAIGSPPTVTAFDLDGQIIASFNIEQFAPIRTPNGVNQFSFIGIDGQGTIISRMSFSGSGIALASGKMGSAIVPEPSSWAMLIAGFGLAGAAMRRRRAAIA